MVGKGVFPILVVFEKQVAIIFELYCNLGLLGLVLRKGIDVFLDRYVLPNMDQVFLPIIVSQGLQDSDGRTDGLVFIDTIKLSANCYKFV